METTSPFASQLGTNYAATKEEAAELTNILAGPICKLADLQDEINRTKAHYYELVERHAELAKEINRYQALMAPIRRLPVDVIREIFINCLPTTHNAVISAQECPILLTRICSGWRNIALSTTVLWASIHVPIPSDVDPSLTGYTPSPDKLEMVILTANRRAEAIKEWFSRSGECVLSISLHNQQHETPAVVYDIILDALIPFCRRWGALKCDAPTSMLIRIANIPDSDLPQLHTLSINGGTFADDVLMADEPHRRVWGWKDSGVVRAPRLRTISYTNMMENFARFPLRWNKLTSITVRGGKAMSLQSLANLFVACPLLHTCRIHIACAPQYLADPVEPMPLLIVMPHLQELDLQMPRVDLSPLLDLLDVPTLSRLDINTDRGLFTARTLHALIRRSAHTLRALTLTPLIFEREVFFASLQVCANLTELTLRAGLFAMYTLRAIPFLSSLTHTQRLDSLDGDTALPDNEETYAPLVFDDAFLRGILVPVPDVGPVILPQLTILGCHMANTFSDTGVVDAMYKRRAAAASGKVAPLRQIHITFSRPQEQSIAQAIDGLEEEGVKCTLDYTPPFVELRKSAATDGISDFEMRSWGTQAIF